MNTPTARSLTDAIIHQAGIGEANYGVEDGPLTQMVNEPQWPCAVPSGMTLTPWTQAEVQAIAQLLDEEAEVVLELAFKEWLQDRQGVFKEAGWDSTLSAKHALERMVEDHPSSPTPPL